MMVRSGESDTVGSGSASMMSAMTFGGVRYPLAGACAESEAATRQASATPGTVSSQILRMGILRPHDDREKS